MGFYIVKGNLLDLKYDALVIPSQPSLALEGVIGNKVKEICGKRLQIELDQCKKINISECVITNAYNLECKRLIHVANPKYFDGNHNEGYDLKSSYISCLWAATDFELESIAFPLLSTGAYKYPKREAINIAIDAINDFLEEHPSLTVALVIYTESIYTTYKDIFKKYKVISGTLSKETMAQLARNRTNESLFWYTQNYIEILEKDPKDRSFAETLQCFMADKKLTKLDCYNGVISKTAFNNLFNGAHPDKDTVISLGINMGLNLNEIRDLLRSAGYHFNPIKPREALILDGIKRHLSIKQINDLLGEMNYHILKFNPLQ